MATQAFEDIADTFEFLDDWEDRYRHVIDLGKAMPEMNDALKAPATKVDGCASQVWIHPRIENSETILSTEAEMQQTIQSYRVPGLCIRDISLPVPLDWSNPDGEAIDLFAREVVLAEHATKDLPLLIFLQGGPGCKGPRPVLGRNAWFAEALKSYRVILLDQRGAGRSSPVTGARIAKFPGGEAGGAYLPSLCSGASNLIRASKSQPTIMMELCARIIASRAAVK